MRAQRHVAMCALAVAALLALGAAAERPRRSLRAAERKALAMEAIARVLPPGQIVEGVSDIEPIAGPVGTIEVEARFPGGDAFRRKASIALEWRADGETLRREQVRATLALELDLPVPARPILAGESIDASSLRVRRVRFAQKPGDVARSAAEVVGRTARRDLAADEPFDGADLVVVPVVRRGERLSVAAEFGRVLVSAAAIAQADGAVGDRVSAELPATNRVVLVEITAPGRGRVVR
jgi:flagella basal body P-ring formation protein FlgA